MKTMKVFLSLVLGILLMTGTSLYAQDNKDKEADRKAAQEKELQAKKEMLEMQHQEMKEQEALLKEKEIEFAEQAEVMRVRARDTERARVYVSTYGDEGHSYFYSPEERGTRSQLTLRNTFNGGSDSSKGDFDVDENIRQFRCMIRGKVREGEILIKVFYPGGKVFKELTINSSAEVTFTQSLSFGDESKDKYVGSWSYEVEAKEARGDYSLSITSE